MNAHVVNETKPLTNGHIHDSSSHESSLESFKAWTKKKKEIVKSEKSIRKHSNGVANGDSSSLSPLIIAPLLATNATLLSALPSLPPNVENSVNKDKKKNLCLLSDSPYYIHKV